MKSLKFMGSVALLLVFITPMSARAMLVSVNGAGFTSFNGVSGAGDGNFGFTHPIPGCNQTQTGYVNGTVVQASSCTPPVGGLTGPASLTFSSPLGSVDFYVNNFGVNMAHNVIGFVPHAGLQTIDSVTDEFVLGSLSFQNGDWFGLGPVNTFHLEVTATGTDPSFGSQQMLSDEMVMDIRVVNGGTPAQNADCLYFLHFTTLGEFCVNEGALGSTTVWGRHGSLIPTRFSDVTGGFVEGAPAVPEPSSLILLGGWHCRNVRAAPQG